jgi:TRAP-type C4-dicarboxylate transport system permease small subunit
MATQFRKAMDALYLACVAISGATLMLIAAVIAWGVYTRYGLNSAASWPEPMAMLLAIVLTFFGAAACYRLDLHNTVGLFADVLPDGARRFTHLMVELLMTVVAVFMLVYGIKLVHATWGNSIVDFPLLSAGVIYLPVPCGGAITLMFIAERLTIGRPSDAGRDPHAPFE